MKKEIKFTFVDMDGWETRKRITYSNAEDIAKVCLDISRSETGTGWLLEQVSMNGFQNMSWMRTDNTPLAKRLTEVITTGRKFFEKLQKKEQQKALRKAVFGGAE